MKGSTLPRHTVLACLAGGLALTLLQILFVIGVQKESRFLGAYRNLAQWDSEHYQQIAFRGYYSDIPVIYEGTVLTRASWIKNTNVAFFPGYPVVIKPFLLFFNWRIASVVAAHFTAIGMWTTFLLLMRRLRIAGIATAAVILLTVSHPAGFYLVAAYSESLFLWGLFGMLLWMNSESKRGWLWTGLHGALASFTRIFGMALFVLPVIGTLADRWPDVRTKESIKEFLKSSYAGIMTLVGGLSFFAYCQMMFGRWDLYFQRQAAGWDIQPTYLLWQSEFLDSLFLWYTPVKMSDGWEVSKSATPITLWFLLAAFAIDLAVSFFRKDKSFRTRVPLWAAAVILFYLPAAALITQAWRSMMRYALIPIILALIALAHLWSRQKVPAWLNVILGIVIAGTALWMGMLEVNMIRIFTVGGWVA